MNRVFIISAPSGAGKSSLVTALREADSELAVAVSHTTRAARPGEENGVNYHFVSVDDFKVMVTDGAFVENAEVYGNFYGTSKAAIADELAKGRDVLVEIDWQGAAQVRAQLEDTVSVFILPPSRESLRDRLRGRGQDSDALIDKRMETAKDELAHWQEYDFIVINDDFDVAVADIQAIMRSSHMQREVQSRRQADLLVELLD